MKKLEGGSWKKYGKFLTSRPSTSNFSTSKLYDFQLPSSDFQHFFLLPTPFWTRHLLQVGEGRGVVGGRDGAEADYCALDDILVYWRGWSEIDNT